MPPKPAQRGEYIETETGNKISRRAQIHGTQNIILAGKSVIQSEVIIRGDLVPPPRQQSQRAPSPTPSSATDEAKPKPSSSSAPQQSLSISLGRYVFISPSTTLRPPSRLLPSPHPGQPPLLQHYPLRLESYITISPSCIIQAASIGSHVFIGSNVIVGNMVIIKDYVKILDGAHLASGSVWPSFSVVGGRPARVVGETGEAWGMIEGGEGGESRGLYRSVRTGR